MDVKKSSQVWKVKMSSLLVKGLVGMNEGVKLWGGRKDELLTSNLKDLKGFISHFHHNFFIFIRIIIILTLLSDIIMIWILYTNVSLYPVFQSFKISLFSELILFRPNIKIFRSRSSSELLCSYYSTIDFIHNTLIFRIISIVIPCYTSL